jgi:transposase
MKGAAMKESFIGVDLHKRFCVFTEIDPQGNVLRRGRFGNNIEEVSAFASTLSPKVKLTVEPLLNYLWFADQVEPYVGSFCPADPYKTRVIAEAKCKTDSYDSLMLAELLRVDFLPRSYLPPKEIRELRELIRQRCYLVRNRAMFKNRIRHLLFLNGGKIEAKDVSSPKARREIGQLYLPDHTRHSIEQCLELIDQTSKMIDPLEDEIVLSCQDIEDIALLETIPGIGRLQAIIIYAGVVDIRRFKSAKAFASYTGLVPTIRASGDNVKGGGITKLGSRPLRTALVEAAMRAPRYSPELNRMYWRIAQRSNTKKARVAVARKLATIVYVMLNKREAFRR